MFGEESALLGLDQPFSYITKSFVTVISFNYQQFFNVLKHQVFYYGKVVEKAFTMESWSEFLTAFWAGK